MLSLEGTQIGPEHPPYFIAEMSANHSKDKNKLKEMIRAAIEAGADAVKFQTYTAETMTLESKENWATISDQKSLWKNKTLSKLYREAEMPWEWTEELFNYSRQLGAHAFSTPFDITAVDFLESLNTPFYKVSSFENGDFPLLKRIGETKKPVIISSGTASISELSESVDFLRSSGTNSICILKCTSEYPAPPETINLQTLPILQKIFPDCSIGLSDHSLGIGISIASIALGARVIERHFKLEGDETGLDAAFSLTPSEFKLLVAEGNKAFLALGNIQLQLSDSDKQARQYRRSLYFSCNLRAGDTIGIKDIVSRRPNKGLEPKAFDSIINKKLKRDVSQGTPTKWDDFI